MLQKVRLSVAIMISLLPGSALAVQQDCRDLKPANDLGLAAGQIAATVMRPQKAAKAHKRHVAFPDGSLDSVHISLKRAPCEGSCPSYSIELSGDGTAAYTGADNVLVVGHHVFDVPVDRIKCLFTQFKKADFWSLEDKYDAGSVDNPVYRISLTIGEHTKTITDNFGTEAGMPGAVTSLENEIDRIGADIWVRGTSETLPALRKEGFDFHSEAAATILANAASKAPNDFVLGLIELGAPVTGQAFAIKRNPFATTVARASRAGRLAVIQAIIAKGAFSDVAPDVVDAALLSAAASGNPAVVAEILKYKPNVNAQDREGDTALITMWKSQYRAADKSTTDVVSVVRLLLAAGADPNIANQYGDTALFSANNSEVVKLLIEAGAEINVRNKSGSTPLLYAGSDEAAVALIEAGADTTVKDRFGDTVEKRATEKNFAETIRLLREKAE